MGPKAKSSDERLEGGAGVSRRPLNTNQQSCSSKDVATTRYLFFALGIGGRVEALLPRTMLLLSTYTRKSTFEQWFF